MSLFWLFTLFSIGLVFIIFGSDLFVDATIWVAKVLRIPDIIIGATLVSLCTTLPELLVSSGAAISGDTSMAIGNAIGSVACNTSLILGIAVVASTPLLVHKKTLLFKSITISSLLIIAYTLGLITGFVPKWMGIVLLLLTIVFVYYNYIEAKKHRKLTKKDNSIDHSKKAWMKNVPLFLLGLAATIIGARMMVNYGLQIAYRLEVPSIIIGVTMTALGTSLPELVTSITALRKKATALSIGNIFGANILNLTLVLGTTTLIKPISMTSDIITIHLPIIIGITLIATFFTIFSKKRYPRIMGIILLASYIGYMVLSAIIAS
ncbi:MAG: calcium/sodium antiporter [Clostridiales bacterium]|nr:calcium/sodium antiporter [Clostridiales bacterium]